MNSNPHTSLSRKQEKETTTCKITQTNRAFLPSPACGRGAGGEGLGFDVLKDHARNGQVWLPILTSKSHKQVTGTEY